MQVSYHKIQEGKQSLDRQGAGDGDEPDEEEVLEREHTLPLRVQALHPAPGAPRPVRPPLLRQQRLPQRRRGSSSAAAAVHLRALAG